MNCKRCHNELKNAPEHLYGAANFECLPCHRQAHGSPKARHYAGLEDEPCAKTFTCRTCGEEIPIDIRSTSDRGLCVPCWNIYNANRKVDGNIRLPRNTVTITCQHCLRSFTANRKTAKFCSPACKLEADELARKARKAARKAEKELVNT